MAAVYCIHCFTVVVAENGQWRHTARPKVSCPEFENEKAR